MAADLGDGLPLELQVIVVYYTTVNLSIRAVIIAYQEPLMGSLERSVSWVTHMTRIPCHLSKNQ